MANVSSLGYVGFAVSDLPKWKTLMVDLLGMQAGDIDNTEKLALRMDDHEQRIILESGAEDDLVYAGWLFDTEPELDEYVAKLRSNGVEVKDFDEAITAERRVEKGYVILDPDGLRHELVVGPECAATPFKSSILRKGFVTGRLGLGHILLSTKKYDEMRDFAKQVLGLRLSDYIRAPLETPHGTIQVDATFFHTVNGRHHSLAIAPVPIPKRMHHIMVEVEDFNDVGLAYDRCLKAGFPIAMGLGHHPNDQMFSFYVVVPSGLLLEFGYGGRVIDDDDWQIRTYPQLSDWGHEAVNN